MEEPFGKFQAALPEQTLPVAKKLFSDNLNFPEPETGTYLRDLLTRGAVHLNIKTRTRFFNSTNRTLVTEIPDKRNVLAPLRASGPYDWLQVAFLSS